MPVAGEPMIRRIVAWLVSHAVRDVVVNLHHRPETIAAVLGDGSDLGARVRYSWEQPEVLGSAGGPRQALSIIGAEEFFIINGDTLTDVDLTALRATHAESGAPVTLALVPNREFIRYGGVLVDEADRVSGFVNRGPAAEHSWHFIGVQIARASIFRDLPAGRPLRTIGGVYDELMRLDPDSVRAFRTDAAFWDVGTAADYWRTSQAFSTSGVDVGRHVELDPTARVTSSVLWDDVAVGAGAVVDSCIVTDGVRVPEGTHHRRSILLESGDAHGLTILPLDV